jgi:Arc/MetJ-type ribon-helix-helix transcriptional regulator
MTTLSIPVDAVLELQLDALVQGGVGSTRAAVVRIALKKFAEEYAVQQVLKAIDEPSLKGDVRALMKAIV